jgi:hypothetical protein
MQRTSLVTKFELDVEVSTRVQRDSFLANFMGQPWTEPSNAMPDYSSTIDIEDGTSLKEAVSVLDNAKNRKIVIQNSLGGVVVSNPKVLRFSGLGMSVIPDGVLITVAGEVVYKPGSETRLGATVQDQRSLEFQYGQGIGVRSGLVTKFFSGGRFAYGMSVSYRQFGSIRAKFVMIDRIILHGCQGRVATPGSETTEMRLGTVVRDGGNLFAASVTHTTSTGNRPTNNPRPSEWRGAGSTNSGECLRFWTKGASYNRGLLVLHGNTLYAVLEDGVTAEAAPPDAPNTYFPIVFPNFGPGTYQPATGIFTDVSIRGQMRTMKYVRNAVWTNPGNWTYAPEVSSKIRFFYNISENIVWSEFSNGWRFSRGDIVKLDPNSPNLYINLAATNIKGRNGSNPMTVIQTPLGPRNFVAGLSSGSIGVSTLNRITVTPDGLNLPVGERIVFFPKVPDTPLGTNTNIEAGVSYYVRSVNGNYLTLSRTLGGDTVTIAGGNLSNAALTTYYPWWYQLTGLVPWTSKLPTVEPGVFYCWGGGKIITPRRAGYVGTTTPSLDDGVWWFINDNYRLNIGSQKTNASNALEWPNVGSNIIITG